jgi:hypothetical protein
MANQQVRTTTRFYGNQVEEMRLHIITSGSYPYTEQEGLIVYFTNAGASLDFTDGEGLYLYDGSAWVRMARQDELVAINNPIIIRGSAAPNGGAMDFPYANPVSAVGMVQVGGGSGGGGSIQAGNAWIVISGSFPATVPGGSSVSPGDMIIALVNTASPTNPNHWTIVEGNNNAATETNAGIIEIATQAEVDGRTDDSRAVTPLKLKTTLANNGVMSSYTQNINGLSGTAIFPDVTALSQIKDIVVLDDDYVPVTIGIGTPVISLGQLNVPWTSSVVAVNFKMNVMAIV